MKEKDTILKISFVRVVIGLAASLGLKVEQIDVEIDFLHSN